MKGPLTLNGIGFLTPKIYCYYKWQKWFLWAITAAQTAENHRDEWDLNWYLQLRIFTSIPTWTTSPNSVTAADAPSSKLPSDETSSNDHKDWPNKHEKSHKLHDEKGHPLLSLKEVQRRLR